MKKKNVKHFYLLVIMSVVGFFFGSLFNDAIHVETGGINRFMFLYALPFTVLLLKLKLVKNNSILTTVGGLSIGIFASDIADAMASIGIFATTFITYSYALYCIYTIIKSRRGK